MVFILLTMYINNFMIKFSELRSIHIEITNRCQASCPMCSRNYRGEVENPLLKISDWTFEDFKEIFKTEVLKTIKRIEFCGNFGDPLINRDFHLMTSYVKDLDIFIDVHTNGSLHNQEFWKKLPQYLPQHRVVFGIDGLADTHSVYRRGTNFEKILKNAREFINAGGVAEWSFIRFKHNEHQIEQAKKLANSIGFSKFYTKDSSRFAFETECAVLDKHERITEVIKPPTKTKVTYFDPRDLATVSKTIQNTDIDCYAQHKKEIYIDAHQKIMPCCFLAAIPYDYSRPNDSLYMAKMHIKNQYSSLIESLGNTDAKLGIKTVIEQQTFQTVWQQYWTVNKLWTCARVCGNRFSKPADQVNSK
jgi:MoaA/NifB/PqqE/SkfB family radical SAM enzyme